jgi:uncharacterized membrane protein
MGKLFFHSPRVNRQVFIIASMLVSSALCMTLLKLRVANTPKFPHQYLAKNLFLAWLPVISALVSYNLRNSSRRLSWILVSVCACLWLVFLPNAPYLITDLVHLYPHGQFSYWYDLIMFFAFAWTGIFLGLVSLYLMQEVVNRIAGEMLSWGFVFIVSGLNGVGIYLGRFLRWNSWDLATQPAKLMDDLLEAIVHPLSHLRIFAFSGLFTLFLISSYLMFVAVTRFNHERDPN